MKVVFKSYNSSFFNSCEVNRSLFFTGLLSLLFLFDNNLNASHIVGGELSYQCLGQGLYELTLRLRRDCSHNAGVPFDETAKIDVYDKFGTPLDYFGGIGGVFLPKISEEEVSLGDNICLASCSDTICVEEAVYQMRVRCQINKNGYILAYQRCCRNESLDNILNPLDAGGTWFVSLTENGMKSCNSNPSFQGWPDPIICKDEAYSFDHGAIDPDGDSLAYHLYVPHIGGSREYPIPVDISGPPYDTVDYKPPYSLDNLMGGNPRLKLNEYTGLLTVTPDKTGQYLIGVLVEEMEKRHLVI